MKAFWVSGILLTIVVLIASCESGQQIEFKRYFTAGREIYLAQCQNCHGESGQGLAALIPPLTDSVYLKANKHLLACYLKNGLKGKITIHGKEFDDQMPANANLAPIQIAEVLTYITNSFGNKQGLINDDAIEQDLKNCK